MTFDKFKTISGLILIVLGAVMSVQDKTTFDRTVDLLIIIYGCCLVGSEINAIHESLK